MHSPEPGEVEVRGQPALCAVQTVTELVHLETGCLPKEGSTAHVTKIRERKALA